MTAAELKCIVESARESQRLERERILCAFENLAKQFEEKANQFEDEYSYQFEDNESLVWTAAASSLRRVCEELTNELT